MTPLEFATEIASELAIETTIENLGGDPELLKELLDFFVEIMPAQLDDLQAAVDSGDVAGVDLQAHAMKGGAANVGAERVAALARDLELNAKAGSLDGAGAQVAALRSAFADLQRALALVDWQALT